MVNHVAGYDNLVEEVPLAVVEQGALSDLAKHVLPGIEDVGARLHVLGGILAAQGFGHRWAVGVVVEVTHDDHLDAWITKLQGFGEALHLGGGLFACPAFYTTAGPVVDDDGHLFVGHGANAHEEATCLVRNVAEEGTRSNLMRHRILVEAQPVVGARLGIDVIDVERVLELEVAGIVKHGAVDAACIGAVEVEDAVATFAQRIAFRQIHDYVAVLDLSKADDGGAVLQTLVNAD